MRSTVLNTTPIIHCITNGRLVQRLLSVLESCLKNHIFERETQDFYANLDEGNRRVSSLA